MTSPHDTMTSILADFTGDASQPHRITGLIPQLYDDLRRTAASLLNSERANHTLQPTALVHEAYLRFSNSDSPVPLDHQHFLRLAAITMRHILVDHARKRGALKRGAEFRTNSLCDHVAASNDYARQILEIDEALQHLSALDSEKASVVELRYFGGCTIEDTASALGLSTATVERHWRFAKAWFKAHFFDEEAR